jgi:hypothetical protein
MEGKVSPETEVPSTGVTIVSVKGSVSAKAMPGSTAFLIMGTPSLADAAKSASAVTPTAAIRVEDLVYTLKFSNRFCFIVSHHPAYYVSITIFITINQY